MLHNVDRRPELVQQKHKRQIQKVVKLHRLRRDKVRDGHRYARDARARGVSHVPALAAEGVEEQLQQADRVAEGGRGEHERARRMLRDGHGVLQKVEN